VLFAKQSNTTTNELKNKIWLSIARKVSACGPIVRTVSEIKHKWHDLQSRVKGKSIDRKKIWRRTGGGSPPPDMTQSDEKVLSIIGKTATDGVKGGIDTSILESRSQSSITEETEEILSLGIPVLPRKQLEVITSHQSCITSLNPAVVMLG
jgi:hypothetical protein